MLLRGRVLVILLHRNRVWKVSTITLSAWSSLAINYLLSGVLGVGCEDVVL